MKELTVRPARQLNSEKYDIFCNYNQNVADLEQFKKDYSLSADVTGLIGIMGDGEIEELWATEDNVPWDLTTIYFKVV